jgi:lipid-A-disaccharide synthase-like uncharacterized protein
MSIDFVGWLEQFVQKLDIWVVIGFTGQAVFMGRMLVQWIVTEKNKRSTIPKIFWHMSLWGSLILLVYAIKRADPVFIAGQAFGFIVYIRNLMLYKNDPLSEPAK